MCGLNGRRSEQPVLHALIAATPNRSDYGDRCLAPGLARRRPGKGCDQGGHDGLGSGQALAATAPVQPAGEETS